MGTDFQAWHQGLRRRPGDGSHLGLSNLILGC